MNRKILLLLPFLTLSLTACEKNIKEEEFNVQLASIRETLTTGEDERLNDIHINNSLSTEAYNYKEGEYYSYKMFALILIVPITQGDYLWKEDGKFYHAETHTDSKKNKKEEITEESFYSRMVTAKQKVINKLSETLTVVDNLQGEHVGYTEVKNSYTYDSSDKTYRFISNTQATSTDENGSETVNKSKIVINFKNNLPTKYTVSGSSKSKWEYKYGSSSFTKPEINSAN